MIKVIPFSSKATLENWVRGETVSEFLKLFPLYTKGCDVDVGMTATRVMNTDTPLAYLRTAPL